jgi:histidyl-tRNA synthetase
VRFLHVLLFHATSHSTSHTTSPLTSYFPSHFPSLFSFTLSTFLHPDQDRVGSIAAGGRYDGLVGVFGSENIPSVGFSVGIERIFTIFEEKNKSKPPRKTSTEVLVASIDKGQLKERMKICSGK